MVLKYLFMYDLKRFFLAIWYIAIKNHTNIYNSTYFESHQLLGTVLHVLSYVHFKSRTNFADPQNIIQHDLLFVNHQRISSETCWTHLSSPSMRRKMRERNLQINSAIDWLNAELSRPVSLEDCSPEVRTFSPLFFVDFTIK
jgi:hypothetical protein